ncbi:MAG: ATP-binding protein [Clostridia bacterium]|jgi:anti-sigma regulatory factor (Ser/Thr protein kinase)|nr:ATP-binding protein [Clostridia bacterium]
MQQEWVGEAKIDRIDDVTEFVNAALEAVDCPMKAQMQIDIAIDEVLANVAQYAYAPGTGSVRVLVDPKPGAVTITFIDRGTPYNPLEHTDPDTTLSAEDRQIGGLGILLVKRTMDAVRYEFRDGQNILSIRKEF